MRSPSFPPSPAATPRQGLATKAARKAATGASTNRPARKATSSHDSATTHKSGRRKNAAHGTTDSATDTNDAAANFAAMLAQNAGQTATATPPTSPAAAGTAGAATESDALGTEAANALLRPHGLTPAVDGNAADAAEVAESATAAETAARAANAESANAAAATAATAATAADATPGASSGPISVPSELASAAHTLATNSADGAATGVHRQNAREAATSDGLPTVTAAGQSTTDVAGAASSSGAGAAGTGGGQSAGDQSATGQQQPDFAGAAGAVGLQNSATGTPDSVSETPMPAHTVAPTIAQVAQSLRTSGDGTSRLVIRLDPEELGPVLVSLRTRGGMVDISVRADNAGGAAAVADQRAHIQQVLAEHGLDLSSFSVSGGEASGGSGAATADAGTSDSSGDGTPNGNAGTDAGTSNYADVQAQASGADGQGSDRRAFSAPQESVGAISTPVPTSSSDGAATPVSAGRREGTWL